MSSSLNTDGFELELYRSRGALFAILAVMACLVFAVLSLQISHPSRYLAADSFTYFTMARVYHESGLLFSYSGIDHTTGVHPAYYLVLTVLYPLFGMMLPQWSFIVNGLMLGAGLFLCYRALSFVPAVAMFVLVLTQQAASSTNNGMESSLAFLVLSTIVFLLSRIPENSPTRGQSVLLGFLLGTVVAARLDTIFFVAAYLMFSMLVSLYHRHTLSALIVLARSLAYMLVPLLTILCGVFLINIHYDGSLLPLSGQLKSSFPFFTEISFSPENLWLLKTFIISLVATGLYLVWTLWRRVSAGILIPALFLSCLTLFLYNALFVYGIGAWYSTLPFFALALVGGLFARDLLALWPLKLMRWRLPFFVICFILVSLVAVVSHRTRTADDWMGPHERAAAFLAERISPGEAAAEFKDGVFAFYAAGMPVYNLTGLGNNQDYATALRTDMLAEYLEERNIVYIVGGNGSGIQVPGARQYLSCAQPFYDEPGVKIYSVSTCRIVNTNLPADSMKRLDIPYDAH